MTGSGNPGGTGTTVVYTYATPLPWRSRIAVAWRVLRTGWLA